MVFQGNICLNFKSLFVGSSLLLLSFVGISTCLSIAWELGQCFQLCIGKISVYSNSAML